MFALHLLSEGGEGPNTSLQWLLYVGVAFFFMVIIVGWLTKNRRQEQLIVQHEEMKPKKKSDDLIKIEGVGPKVANVLGNAGITTFDDLAHAKAADVQKVLNEANLQMLNPEGWITQAKLAAKGDWEGFEKLQSKLKGGRKIK